MSNVTSEINFWFCTILHDCFFVAVIKKNNALFIALAKCPCHMLISVFIPVVCLNANHLVWNSVIHKLNWKWCKRWCWWVSLSGILLCLTADFCSKVCLVKCFSLCVGGFFLHVILSTPKKDKRFVLHLKQLVVCIFELDYFDVIVCAVYCTFSHELHNKRIFL